MRLNFNKNTLHDIIHFNHPYNLMTFERSIV